MRYEVKITPGTNGKIVHEVDIVQDYGPHSLCNVRENILRQIIDTLDASTKKALEQLGWTAPGSSATLNLAPPIGPQNPLGQTRHVTATYVLDLEQELAAAKRALTEKIAAIDVVDTNVYPAQYRRVTSSDVLKMEEQIRQIATALHL